MEFSDVFHQNHEHPKIIMAKTTQAGKRCRDLHQTDFPSRIPRSQKPRNSKGFCEDNLPPQMAEQNSQGRGMGDTATSSNPRPSRAVMRFLFAYQIQCWLLFQYALAVIMDRHDLLYFNTKIFVLDFLPGSILVHFELDFKRCSGSSGFWWNKTPWEYF